MALYNSKGTISYMSPVSSGVSASGHEWQRMQIVLDVPGSRGTLVKQCFRVFGDVVDEVLHFCVGDKVEVKWVMYAREWNGRWLNDIDLVNINYQEEKPQQAPARPQAYSPKELDPNENEDLPI